MFRLHYGIRKVNGLASFIFVGDTLSGLPKLVEIFLLGPVVVYVDTSAVHTVTVGWLYLPYTSTTVFVKMAYTVEIVMNVPAVAILAISFEEIDRNKDN